MTENDHISVALVDDQPLVRAGFSMVIGAQPDMRVIFEAATGREAVTSLAAHMVDVMIMDVRMPDMDGIAATEHIVSRMGEQAPKIIMLTTFDLDEYVGDAIRAGASGFLLKDSLPEDLLTAIRTVHRGDAVIAPSATKRLLGQIASLPAKGKEDLTCLASLTEREREVLTHMAYGQSNAEIASSLFLAEATVKTHVGRVLSKIGARDRVQAVITAFETGLVRPGDEPQAR